MHELEFGNQTSNFSVSENISIIYLSIIMNYQNSTYNLYIIRKTVKMLYSIRSPGYETLKLKLVCSFLLSPFQIALM